MRTRRTDDATWGTTRRATLAAAALLLAACWAAAAPSAPPTATTSALSTESTPSIAPSAPSPLTVTAAVDRNEIEIGDPLTYALTIEWPDDFETPSARAGRLLGVFEVVDQHVGRITNAPGGRRRQTQRLRLAAYDIGDFEIPPLTIGYRSRDGATTGTLATPPIPIKVVGVAGADSAKDLRGLKPPAVLTADHTLRNWLIAGGVALALIAAALIWRWRVLARRARQSRVPPPAPPRPEDEVALEALEALLTRLPATREEAMVFYVELSNIVRVFLGRRFDFDAMDRTTSEIVASLRDHALGNGALDTVGRFLDACDLVKFAKYPATRELALAGIEEARGIVAQNRRADAE